MDKSSSWTDFPQKLVLAAFGILFTMLVSYFVWLGQAMVEVRQKVTAIEQAVASLNATREQQAEMKADKSSSRIDALERK